MTPFEEELKRALSHQQPAPDFTARVLAQVQKPGKMIQPPRFWGWAAAAAAALIMTSGALYQHHIYQQHEYEVQGEAAKRKLMVALHIAGTKLQQTQERVQEVGESQ